MSRLYVIARALRDGLPYTFEVRGQTAKALLALVDAGDRGITAMQAATWAYRLAAYCHELRKHHGLDVVTRREDHPSGWHGRHVLLTPVEIVAVDGLAVAA